jgi:hypothetical protein
MIKKALSQPVAGTTQTRSTDFDVPQVYAVRLVKAGFLDEVFTVAVPTGQRSYDIPLRRSGLIPDIECLITVDYRPEYYEDIDSVIRDHAYGSSLNESEPRSLDPEGKIIQKEYGMFVKDSAELERLVGDLEALATEKDFAFKIFNAEFAADFSTTIIEAEIAHVVRGRVRKGADLFLFTDGRFYKVPEEVPGSTMDEDGNFTMVVKIHKNQRYIYYKSIYHGRMNDVEVYNRLDVIDDISTEITLEDFNRETAE